MVQIKANPEDVLIGKRLREIRIASGYTQKQLAEELGVTFQQFQKYENGNNRISLSSMCKLSKVINIDLNSFKELDGNAEYEFPEDHSIETKMMLKTYYSLPKEIRKKSHDLLRSISNDNY